MGLINLSLETLKDLDFGAAEAAFRQALERAVQDCLDRPGDDRARKILLQMTLKPVKVIRGNTIDCDGARGLFQVRCKIPDWETREVDFGVRNNGTLYFSPESPDNHRQGTLLPADAGGENA